MLHNILTSLLIRIMIMSIKECYFFGIMTCCKMSTWFFKRCVDKPIFHVDACPEGPTFQKTNQEGEFVLEEKGESTLEGEESMRGWSRSQWGKAHGLPCDSPSCDYAVHHQSYSTFRYKGNKNWGGECQLANRLCFIAALTRRKETLEAGTNWQ